MSCEGAKCVTTRQKRRGKRFGHGSERLGKYIDDEHNMIKEDEEFRELESGHEFEDKRTLLKELEREQQTGE